MADQEASSSESRASSHSSKTDERLDKITKLQKRAEFATDDVSPSVAEVAVGRDIEALRGGSAPAKRARRKTK